MTPEELIAAQELAANLHVEFQRWQERRVAEYNKRVRSILEAWGIRIGKA